MNYPRMKCTIAVDAAKLNPQPIHTIAIIVKCVKCVNSYLNRVCADVPNQRAIPRRPMKHSNRFSMMKSNDDRPNRWRARIGRAHYLYKNEINHKYIYAYLHLWTN